MWLDKYFTSGYSTVENNGVALPLRAILNFIGATLADNSGNASTDVTLSGPPAPVRLSLASSSKQLTAAQSGATVYLDNSGGAFTALLPTTGLVDDMSYQFKQPKQADWTSSSPSVQDASGKKIEDLIASGTYPTNSVTPTLAGGDFTLRLDLTNNVWVQGTGS